LARKITDTVHVNFRMREPLRRRLEAAAKQHRVSLNGEMRLRLEASFEDQAKRTMDEIAGDMARHWARFGEAFHNANLTGDLLRASEQLVAAVEADDKQKVVEAVERVKTAAKMIDIEKARAARQAHTSGRG
jgi:hypothetical protein